MGLGKKLQQILEDHEAGEVERLATIIARIHISGSIDDEDVSPSEWRKIVFLDRVARRAAEIQDELEASMGVTVLVDPTELEPQEDEDV